MQHPSHSTLAASLPPAWEPVVLDSNTDSRWLEVVSEYLESAAVAVDDPVCTRENYAYFEESR